MRITIECDYALRIVLYLAKIGMENKTDASTIAETQKIPQRFSAKILRKLTMAKVIKSFKGVKGGYSLVKPPNEIALLDIVEIIDGKIEVNRCVNSSYDCARLASLKCPIHNELAKINESIKYQLAGISFEDLLKKTE